MSDVVSLHPYFRAHDAAGLAAFRDLLPRFVEKTRSEPACLFYDFTVNGDEIFCREAYRGAAGVQAHLANVGDAKSLVIHPASTTHFRMSIDELARAGIGEGTVRLSVGLEDPADLLKDLDRGLAAAARAAEGAV